MVRCAPSIGSGSARVAFNRGRLAPRSGAQQPFHRSRPDDGLHARSPIEYGYFVRSAICWMAIHSPASAVDHQKMPPEKSALAKSPVLKGCRSRFLKLLDGYAHAKVSAVILLLLPGHRHAGFFWLMECDCRKKTRGGFHQHVTLSALRLQPSTGGSAQRRDRAGFDWTTTRQTKKPGDAGLS